MGSEILGAHLAPPCILASECLRAPLQPGKAEGFWVLREFLKNSQKKYSIFRFKNTTTSPGVAPTTPNNPHHPSGVVPDTSDIATKSFPMPPFTFPLPSL